MRPQLNVSKLFITILAIILTAQFIVGRIDNDNRSENFSYRSDIYDNKDNIIDTTLSSLLTTVGIGLTTKATLINADAAKQLIKQCYYYQNQPCEKLPPSCFHCEYNSSCIFGLVYQTTCTVKSKVNCHGPGKIQINYTCAYCFQLPESNYDCQQSKSCRSNSKYLTNCTVSADVHCLGQRNFQRFKTCNFSTGYRWSTALILSITLGGFGIDRFYLGYWPEGIGKLCSFGGFGVWTLVDIILIATGYLKPADGSRYV